MPTTERSWLTNRMLGNPASKGVARRGLGSLGAIGRLGLRGLEATGPLTVPLDVQWLIEQSGLYDASHGREFLSEDYKNNAYMAGLDQRDITQQAVQNRGTAQAMAAGRHGMEGISRLAGLYGANRPTSLEELIAEDKGLLGQLSQQSPPTLAEIYAAAGVL